MCWKFVIPYVCVFGLFGLVFYYMSFYFSFGFFSFTLTGHGVHKGLGGKDLF